MDIYVVYYWFLLAAWEQMSACNVDAMDGGFLLLLGSFGKFGEDEAVEGSRGLRGAFGGRAEMESGKRIGKGTLALLADIAV